MTDKVWKQTERRIAKKINSERTPLSGGSSRHTLSDTLHEKLFIESKYRKKIPFLKTFNETKILAKKESKIPMVVFKQKSQRGEIVMMDFDDFLGLIDEEKIQVL
jgi:hypothetical protein